MYSDRPGPHAAAALSWRRLSMRAILPLMGLVTACSGVDEAPGELVADATAVLHGRLFDAQAGASIPEGTVVLVGDRIACAGAPGACRWPEGTPEHSYDDATLLPGLIDLHAHIRRHFVAAYAAAGVTTIRDVSNTVGTIRAARETPGAPRILATGAELDGPESFLAPVSETAGRPGEYPLDDAIPLLVSGSEEARRAVGELEAAGMQWLKLREMLDPESFQALIDAGREAGMPATADLGLLISGGLRGPQVDIVDAARMGIACLEHFSGLPLAYVRRGGDPMASEPDEEILDAIADDLVAAGVHLVPTAAVLHLTGDREALEHHDLPGVEAFLPHLSPHWQALEERAAAERVQEAIAADLRLWQGMLDRLRGSGLLIGAGSDAPNAPWLVPGAGLHQELAALVAAGLSPVEALQGATWNAARILGREDLGRLGPEAVADVVVVRGDPLQDIRRTRDVVAVWLGGEPVDLEAAWARLAADLDAVEGPIWHPAGR